VSAVEVLRAHSLEPLPHGFLGRIGGVSEGSMAGLNAGFGSGDDRAAIDENRRRAVAAVMPRAQLATVHQVHSPEVVYVEHAWRHDQRPSADAMVTDRPCLLLGILTADCAPVLLADRDARVVGAAHAGWRGALAGVTDATIAAMERLGARREHIGAAVGPCIGPASYEVDDGFRATFLDEDPANDRFFAAGPAARPHFDLPGYVRHRLLAAGVGEVELLRLDTYSDERRFFSYRRSTHRGEPSYGRQLSMIAMAG